VPNAIVKRPVARALCFDDLDDPVSETFEFSARPEVSLKRARKSQASRIIVDTKVQRSACLSALRDGYRKVTGGISPKKSHTLKKCKTSNSQSENSHSVQPPTAIANLQCIGARLRIAPEKISTDKLVADPAKSSSSQGSGLWRTVIAIYLSFLVQNYVMLVCCVGRCRSLRGLFTMLLLLACNESDKI